MRRALAFAAVLWILGIGCSASPLTILYTNDLHLNFSRLASIEQRIAEERARGMPILLLDGGDAWQDFRRPLAAVWGADEMVDWMNRVGYDAMALGNHDLYWGPWRLEQLAERATFSILCSNLRPIRAGSSPFAASARLDVQGTSVLLVGLITDQWLPYPSYPAYRWIPPEKAVQEELDRGARRSDLLVVIAHLPIAEAIRVASEVPAIDVFITGHSHERTDDPIRVGDTLIVQTGAFAENLGRLVVDIDPASEEHRLIAHELLPTEKAPLDVEQGLLRLLAVACTTAAVLLLVLL